MIFSNHVLLAVFLTCFICPAISTESHPRSKRRVPLIAEELLPDENESMHVAFLASSIEKVCHASDIRKDMNRYAYTCFLEKPSPAFQEIVDHFKLCCEMMTTCSKLPEDTSKEDEKECIDRFCGCLDMINIVHEPRITECMSSKLPVCKQTTSIWGHDVSWLEDDIGFMRVVNRNVILGRAGIAAFSIALILSTASFAFLVYVCISYRCCKKPKPAEPVPPAEPEVATAYYPTEVPSIIPDAGDTTAQTPPANNTTSVASTTRSSAANKVPGATTSVDNTVTKELIEWP
uniref:Chondroitin proteoglycan 4 domain-containing protein n=1 Tax=Panagrellus redivivus TaxID=6233 RepID=A0A7E4VSU3_PANRE